MFTDEIEPRDRAIRESEVASFIFNCAMVWKSVQVAYQSTDRFGTNLSVRAADYGLVPHMESVGCPSCPRASRRLMQMASVLRYRLAHPDGIYGMTVMREVLTATSK